MTGIRQVRGWLLIVALAVLWFVALGRAPLTLPDEGRYTLIPQEMLASGDFLTPRLDGVLYFEKPPLHYWLTALSVAAFGPTGWGARLWCALLGLGTIVLTWHLARHLGGHRAGAVAAGVLATSPLFFGLSRTNTLDMTLTFFLTATLVAFWHAQRDRSGRFAWYLAAASAALSVMTKGLIGLVLPGGVVLLFLAATGGWRLLARVPWLSTLTIFFLIAAPWHVAMASRHPDFLDFYFVHEHFLRFATPSAERHQPFWYFLAVVAVGMLPWTPQVVAALGRLATLRRRPARAARPELVFLAAWAAFVILFFSISKSKLAPYVLPALPPLAVLVGLSVAPAEASDSPGLRRALRLGAILLFALAGSLGVIGLDLVPAVEAIGEPLPWLVAFAGASAGLALWSLFAPWRSAERASASLFAAAVLFLAALVVSAPPLLVRRTATAVAPRLLRELGPDDLVFSIAQCPYDLAATIGRPIGVVDQAGELDFGIGHLSPDERRSRFPDLAAFRTAWASNRAVWLVVRERHLRGLAKLAPELGPPLVGEGEYRLYRNHREPAALAAE